MNDELPPPVDQAHASGWRSVHLETVLVGNRWELRWVGHPPWGQFTPLPVDE